MSDFFKLIRLTEVDSTNTYAKKFFSEGKIIEPTVIVADTQTQGRGQMQTMWHDAAGQNLLLTIALPDANLHVNQFFLLNIATSVALYKVVAQYGRAAIKWPNDILLDERKVAGILIENSILGDRIKTVFIGVGLNVNQHFWPEGLRATSLFEAHGVALDLKQVLVDFLAKMQQALQFMHRPTAKSEYLLHLFGHNQVRLFKNSNGEFLAKIIAVDDDGALVVLKEKTQYVERYRFKEIEFVF